MIQSKIRSRGQLTKGLIVSHVKEGETAGEVGTFKPASAGYSTNGRNDGSHVLLSGHKDAESSLELSFF